MRKVKWIAGFMVAAAGSAALAEPTLTTLVSFNGFNGANPAAGLVADAQGNFYGTTQYGGPKYNASTGTPGDGTVFTLSAGTRALTQLTSFDYNTTGAHPVSRLALDGNGNLYGTTQYGSAFNDGTIFKVNPASRSLSTIMTFDGTNGALPNVGVVKSSTGLIYAATGVGGASGDGFLLQVAPQTSRVTVVYSFNHLTNTGGPYLTDLAADTSGNIYGISSDIFKFSPTTSNMTLLAHLDSGEATPIGAPAFDAAGNIYGVAETADGKGTIYVVDAALNNITNLVVFNGADGANPEGGVIFDAAGNIFGTTNSGGAYDDGTIFRIDAASHVLTTLVSFDGADGAQATGNLVADSAGNLYGTTRFGGASDLGTVYELRGAGFVVPEPSSIAMLSIGLTALLGRRRR